MAVVVVLVMIARLLWDDGLFNAFFSFKKKTEQTGTIDDRWIGEITRCKCGRKEFFFCLVEKKCETKKRTRIKNQNNKDMKTKNLNPNIVIIRTKKNFID